MKKETQLMSLTWMMRLFRELWIHVSASPHNEEDVELGQVKKTTGLLNSVKS